MTLNFNELSALNDAIKEMQEQKLPFKISLILAKNLTILNKEMEFYIEQERKFALEYLETDENGQFVQEGDGVFRIKEGKEEECRNARVELNEFTCECELRKLPMSALENLEFTPKQLAALDVIIDEEA